MSNTSSTTNRKKKAGSLKTKTGNKKASTKARKKTATALKNDAGRSQGELHSSKAPISVIIILILATVIIFLVNRLYFSGNEAIKIGKSHTKEKDNTASIKDKDRDKEISSRKSELQEKRNTGAENPKRTGEILPEREVKIYLLRFNEKTEQVTLYPARRKIKADIPVLGALRELVKGMNQKEKQAGLLTAVPERLVIRNIFIKNKIATIDFNEAIEENASGSIIQSRIDQIVYTATQFEEIEGIIIQLNGKTRNFIGGDGLALNFPIKRKKR